jgi:hypothetical protein
MQVQERLGRLTMLFTATFQNGETARVFNSDRCRRPFIVRDSGAEPYIINLNSTYRLPFFAGPKLTRTLFGGWNVAGFDMACRLDTRRRRRDVDRDRSGISTNYAHRFNTCTFNNNTNTPDFQRERNWVECKALHAPPVRPAVGSVRVIR